MEPENKHQEIKKYNCLNRCKTMGCMSEDHKHQLYTI